VQGVRWGWNLRARSCKLCMQGVRWAGNLRARSCALSVQGVRWVCNLRARSSALYSARSAVVHQYANTVVSVIIARSAVGINLRARSYTLYMQGVREVRLARTTTVLAKKSKPFHYTEVQADYVRSPQLITRSPPPPLSTLQTVLERSVGCYTRPRSRLSVPP
jgi:hypothetical protein